MSIHVPHDLKLAIMPRRLEGVKLKGFYHWKSLLEYNIFYFMNLRPDNRTLLLTESHFLHEARTDIHLPQLRRRVSCSSLIALLKSAIDRRPWRPVLVILNGRQSSFHNALQCELEFLQIYQQ